MYKYLLCTFKVKSRLYLSQKYHTRIKLSEVVLVKKGNKNSKIQDSINNTIR
jgi:hypothetical protein